MAVRNIILLASAAVIVSLLGGSSRFDAVQLMLLRPVCALLLGLATIVILARGWPREMTPLAVLIGAIVAATLAQLVPLPPGIWQSLPGRDLIARMDSALGMADVWRPLTLTPGRTLNAAFALLVPAAALAAVAAARPGRRQLMAAICAIGTASAFLGLIQTWTGAGYYYAISNEGSPVGLLANRNHAALLSAISLLLALRMLADCTDLGTPAWHRLLLGFAIVPLAMSLVLSGSRIGLLLGLLAATYGIFVWLGVQRSAPSRRGPKGSNPGRLNLILRLAPVAAFLLVALGITTLALEDRIPALERILAEDPVADLRGQLGPSLRLLIETFGAVGSGFGSFDRVYMIFEPDELMQASYINQAHNDLAQLVIEGGLPAVLILVAAVVWIAVRLAKGLRERETRDWSICWIMAAGFFLAASLVDYPLRAPLIQFVAVWLLTAVAAPSGDRPLDGPGRKRVHGR